ncbi:YggT family protein [Catenovulum maritimum]|uniref:Membrane protein n=1 Tax=Catenovulum maritimum TaxID=1513271 RepID=A0A0J8GX77_9ALTE|nr:YggT family protein [Catenovulum maritimum]KMT65859.1 membrane protein [Catenovulum maritimum]
MQAINFLIDTLFGLFLMVVVLRFWLQAVRADFYNPICQFIVKATNPVLKPLQLFLPSAGKFNVAALVLAVIVSFTKLIVLYLVNNQAPNPVTLLIVSLFDVAREFLNLAFWILIIRAILSWFSQGYNPAEMLLHQLTEPFLKPIRKLLPDMGGLDLSLLVAIIAIQFFKILLSGSI